MATTRRSNSAKKTCVLILFTRNLCFGCYITLRSLLWLQGRKKKQVGAFVYGCACVYIKGSIWERSTLLIFERERGDTRYCNISCLGIFFSAFINLDSEDSLEAKCSLDFANARVECIDFIELQCAVET